MGVDEFFSFSAKGRSGFQSCCSSVGVLGVAVSGGGSGAGLHEVSMDDSTLLDGDN